MQTRNSKMSWIPKNHPGAWLFPPCLFLPLPTHTIPIPEKRKKIFISLRCTSIVQSAPLSQSKTACWSTSSHWTEGRKTPGQSPARCAAFIRPKVQSPLHRSDQSLNFHSHIFHISLVRISSPAVYFEDRTHHFHCFVGILCFKNMLSFICNSWIFSMVPATVLAPWCVLNKLWTSAWRHVMRFPVNLGSILKNESKLKDNRVEGNSCFTSSVRISFVELPSEQIAKCLKELESVWCEISFRFLLRASASVLFWLSSG